MPPIRGNENIKTVAVIGGGVIGSGWVAAFLGHGLRVRLFDPSPDASTRTRDHVTRAWAQMVALDRANAIDDWSKRLTIHDSLDEVIMDADFVQENTPEKVDLKRELFTKLDLITPADILIASSTSSLSITELASDCMYPQRFVLGHPFNPVHLMPLVEVGGGDETSIEAIDTALDFYTRLGKTPIRLNCEIFGHIANRLTSAMFREAVSLVSNGVATVSDIDKAIQYGPALKWAIQGQFTTFHTSGGPGGLADFLPKFSPGIIKRWESMADPDLADTGLQQLLIEQMGNASKGKSVEDIAQHQDHYLMEILSLLTKE